MTGIRALLAAPGLKIAHNLAFDLPRLQDAGYEVTGPFWDTMLAQHLVDPDGIGFSLNEVAPFWLEMGRWKHLPGPRPKALKLKSWKRPITCHECGSTSFTGGGVKDTRICEGCVAKAEVWKVEEWNRQHADYNLKDAAVLIPLQEAQARHLRMTGQYDLFVRMMETVSTVLIPLQRRGLRVSTTERDKVVEWYQRRERYALRTLQKLIPGEAFNPYSTAHVHRMLYSVLGLKPRHKRGTERVTADEETIRVLSESTDDVRTRKVLGAILRARGARKYWRTYGAISDRIYPRYSPGTKEGHEGGRKSLAATGRILAKGDRSTGTPPIQQIPRRLRRLFLPEHGHRFVQGDWKQQELRLIATFAGCRFILDSLDRKPDFFDLLMDKYRCDRVRAKNLFYGLWAYGGSARAGQAALRAQGFAISLAECQELILDGKRLVPEIFAWQDQLYRETRVKRAVVNPFGRRRPFPKPEEAYNEILNYPIQSTGADMLWAVLPGVDKISKAFKGEVKLLVHDSIGCSVPTARAEEFAGLLRKAMEREWPEIAKGFSVPVDIKIGKNWGEVS